MAGLEREITDRIDAIFAEWDSTVTPGASLAVARDGEVVYARGYGMSNLELGVPITPDSIFHVASITKQFTCMCIALLAADGKLTLDDDIRQYVPEIPDYGQKITIRHLVHHTSGLRDQWDLLGMAGWRDDVDLITEGDVLEIAGRQTALNFAPGEKHLYCNTGYTALATIIKRVSGQSFREYAHEHIFVPLDMSRTHVHDDHAEVVHGRTQAYYPRGDGDGHGRYRIAIPVFDVAGTTSLHATVLDMVRWGENFAHARVGGEAVIEQLLTRGVLNNGEQIDYAMGISRGEYRGTPVIGHGGADAGYRAHFMRLPEHGVTVAICCNLGTMAPNVLAEQVVDAVLDDQLAPKEDAGDFTPIELPQEQIAARAGIYRDEESGDLVRLELKDGRLTMNIGIDVSLVPVSEHEFRTEQWPIRLIFDPEQPGALMVDFFGNKRAAVAVPIASYSADDLAAMAGQYTSAELGVDWTLAARDGDLVLQRRKYDDTPLKAGPADVFSVSYYRLELTRDADGRVDGFGVNTGRTHGVRFARV